MRKTKSEISLFRRKLPLLLLVVSSLYLLFLISKSLRFLTIDLEDVFESSSSVYLSATKDANHQEARDFLYGRITGEIARRRNRTSELSYLEQMAEEAWILGSKAWEEIEANDSVDSDQNLIIPEECPSSVSVIEGGFTSEDDREVSFPCGLSAGSSVTVIGTPHYAHTEFVPQIARIRNGDGIVSIAQFVVELQGLKTVEGEAPPKILHLNPRLRGDWSKVPIIEHNTCYRMQWGTAQRCDGTPSSKHEHHMVDGFLRCEKWDPKESEHSREFEWYKRFTGRERKPELTFPFPLIEGKVFALTIRAGVEDFHIIIDGHHFTSFPYRLGFTVEDATLLAIKGGVEVHAVHATSLPSSRGMFSASKLLEMSEKWRSNPLPSHQITLFIGILSASNHFAERMAIRKTWMRSSRDVVVRFFVALSPRKEINSIIKKEAEFFSDLVILPFVDRYELVVLKTIAICDFGVRNVSAAYVMKCDDDTYVRIDTVLEEIKGVRSDAPLYMGNINMFHRPLRRGKWAVTYDEWAESEYPPYANGPGYVISRSVAEYVARARAEGNLRIFKMEDVSMGMWVQQMNASERVQYSHSWKFCQYGCMEGYFTAHYQSPRQMICLSENLAKGRAKCCN